MRIMKTIVALCVVTLLLSCVPQDDQSNFTVIRGHEYYSHGYGMSISGEAIRKIVREEIERTIDKPFVIDASFEDIDIAYNEIIKISLERNVSSYEAIERVLILKFGKERYDAWVEYDSQRRKDKTASDVQLLRKELGW